LPFRVIWRTVMRPDPPYRAAGRDLPHAPEPKTARMTDFPNTTNPCGNTRRTLLARLELIAFECRLPADEVKAARKSGKALVDFGPSPKPRRTRLAHFQELLRSFQWSPFSLSPLLIRHQRIYQLLDLLACQVEGLRSGFRAARMGCLHSCKCQLDQAPNGFRAGQLIVLTRDPSIQFRKRDRL
jgi:hypothetical protein